MLASCSAVFFVHLVPLLILKSDLGLTWWSSGWDSELPVQGWGVQSMVGKLDFRWCNKEFPQLKYFFLSHICFSYWIVWVLYKLWILTSWYMVCKYFLHSIGCLFILFFCYTEAFKFVVAWFCSFLWLPWLFRILWLHTNLEFFFFLWKRPLEFWYYVEFIDRFGLHGHFNSIK